MGNSRLITVNAVMLIMSHLIKVYTVCKFSYFLSLALKELRHERKDVWSVYGMCIRGPVRPVKDARELTLYNGTVTKGHLSTTTTF